MTLGFCGEAAANKFTGAVLGIANAAATKEVRFLRARLHFRVMAT